MEAAEAKVQRVLEGSKQFLVPHYQRPYSWREEQWKALWSDVVELLEDEDPKPHFLGSIVTAPARSTPEGVEKRLLIDGQQRLTTLIILLALVRDRARETGVGKLAERIQDLITNRHEEGNERYKLLPTQAEDPSDSDREAFIRLVNAEEPKTTSKIGAAYKFFSARLRRADAPNLEALALVICNKLTLVSIILDEKDNPHRIFESLNGTGRPLSQADLIRNFFFMRLDEKEHERVYLDYWRPMQQRVGEDALTDFVRHYLTKFGSVIRETDVYAALKNRIDGNTDRSPMAHLKELALFSEYYAMLLKPEKSPSERIRERLLRIQRLEVTVAYPFLLALYADFAAGARTEDEVCAVLDVVENFVVRRFVCGVPTHGLNKIFAPLYEQARKSEDFLVGLKKTLSSNTRSYPRDEEFRERLGTAPLYGGGDRLKKTKLLLERLEVAQGHKELVPGTILTIEHVMPQTLTDAWKASLGESWDEDHDQYLHTLGNLTLTSYNSELSNEPFAEKKHRFADSHVEMNKYFSGVERWTSEEIDRRSEVLTGLALSIWTYFGPPQANVPTKATDGTRVTGTVPTLVRFGAERVPVQSWADVAFAVIEGISKLGDEEFDRVAAELPKFANRDATAFRRTSRLRKLSNGAYVETNLSADAVYRSCLQAVQLAAVAHDHWEVTYSTPTEEDGSVDLSSQVKQLQQEFWAALRPGLLASGQFPSLASPRPQGWFELPLGRTGIWLSLSANTQDRHVGVNVSIDTGKHPRALQIFEAQREAIDQEVGLALQWNPHPEKRTKVIKATFPVNVMDRDSWPAAIDWLTKSAVTFHKAFAPRIAQLDLKQIA
jgi:uncharacterized protein with ParB-like and HNH nuclease domain